MAITLSATPRIPSDVELLDANEWASTYDATTHVSELRARDHVTAQDCITLEQFRQLRAEGRA